MRSYPNASRSESSHVVDATLGPYLDNGLIFQPGQGQEPQRTTLVYLSTATPTKNQHTQPLSGAWTCLQSFKAKLPQTERNRLPKNNTNTASTTDSTILAVKHFYSPQMHEILQPVLFINRDDG